MPDPVNQTPRAEVDGWWGRLVRRLASPHCLLCREAGQDGHDLCAACTATLPWLHAACLRCAIPLPATGIVCDACLSRPPPVTETRAAFVYGHPLDRLLPRLKFHRDLAAGRVLADAMARAFASLPLPDAIVPIPLHTARLRRRGYDQALELAKPLARRLALPLLADSLRRVRETTPQSRLDARARKRNLRGAFIVSGTRTLPAHVALVDDVMTTGATLHSAARALHRAGVARVDAWVCARVP